MNGKNILLAGGIAALGLVLIACRALLNNCRKRRERRACATSDVTRMKIMQSPQAGAIAAGPQIDREEEFAIAVEDEGGSWLGWRLRKLPLKDEGAEAFRRTRVVIAKYWKRVPQQKPD